MKFIRPVSLYNAEVSSMKLQPRYLGFVQVGFNVIAEVADEKELPLAVPKKGMVQDLCKQKFMGMGNSLGLFKDEL